MRTSFPKAAVLVLATGILALPQIAAADETDDFIVQRLYDAAMAGDTGTALDMMTDDIFFTIVPAPSHPMWSEAPYLSGKEAVGAWLEVLASDNGRMEIVELTVDGNRAMFSDAWRQDYLSQLGIEPAMFDGFALLRDDKVAALMFAFTPEVFEAMAAAQN